MTGRVPTADGPAIVLGLASSLTLVALHAAGPPPGPLVLPVGGVELGEVHRLVSYAFVHTSWPHVMVNAVGLALLVWRSARGADWQQVGTAMVAGILAGAGAYVRTHSLVVSGRSLAGASAGVAGLAGLLVVQQVARWRTERDPEVDPITFVALLVLLPIGTSATWVSHLGGFLGGVVVAMSATPSRS